MLGLKRLLVATDFSSRADKAIARAVRLAEEHGATVSVVYILTGASGREPERLRIASQIEKDLRRKLDDLSPKKKALVSVRVLSGTPLVARTQLSGVSRARHKGRSRNKHSTQVAVRVRPVSRKANGDAGATSSQLCVGG